MTEREFRAKAREYGYSDEEVEDLIQTFRVDEIKWSGEPFPWDEIPLTYQLY